MVEIPDRAYDIWRTVRRTGQAPEGYVGGRAFRNRERKLPVGDSYREYDIDPLPGNGPRNAERLILNAHADKAWYTPDHYNAFYEMLSEDRKGGDDETGSD